MIVQCGKCFYIYTCRMSRHTFAFENNVGTLLFTRFLLHSLAHNCSLSGSVSYFMG